MHLRASGETALAPINVIYVGPLDTRHHVHSLADAFMAAQRGGLPVSAVDGGAAATLIENGRSGFLVPDDAAAPADAIRWLCRRATLRERLATGGRLAAGTRQASGQGRIMTA